MPFVAGGILHYIFGCSQNEKAESEIIPGTETAKESIRI
jgi:hypothetical protein